MRAHKHGTIMLEIVSIISPIEQTIVYMHAHSQQTALHSYAINAREKTHHKKNKENKQNCDDRSSL